MKNSNDSDQMLFNGCVFLGFAEEGAEPVQCEGPCDPCICKGIPGLVYNAETDQCAWPDEVGCNLNGNNINK